MTYHVQKSPVQLFASAKAVITLYLSLPGPDRVQRIAEKVAAMNEEDEVYCMQQLEKEFQHRHHNLVQTFLHHFHITEKKIDITLPDFSDGKKILLGAFLTKEYSIQSAALFNPSIVPHPDQTGLQPGAQRFVMSLRATGEGHISSIVFQTGILNEKGDIQLDEHSGYYSRLQKNEDAFYTKAFIEPRAAVHPSFDPVVLEMLPDRFVASQAADALSKFKVHPALKVYTGIVEEILDTNYELISLPGLPINEKVIFPNARCESMGMEDVRFVKFQHEDRECYYGTYTAYDGKRIRTQLIETADFNTFKIRNLFGEAIADKGMALFPEKVNGKYMMITRQGGEHINIMSSDDLYKWETYELLMTPKYLWELVQLGNCGSPVKTEKGWLLLTHGVGLMRKYVISAVLLELNNPANIIGRLDKPILEADGTEREGYVPNVVYTCGFIRHGNLLVIPYAVSDSAIRFATVQLDEILRAFNH